MSASDRIAKARWQLSLSQPFFGALAMGSKIIEDEAVGTMCTDGKSIRYAPSFVEAHTQEEITGVMAHEAMHIAFKHMLRKGDFDHKVWNMATDYAINLIVVDSGLTIPDNGLLDRKYEGMSAEEIYHQLLEEGAGGGGQGGEGESGEGDQSDSGSDGEGWNWGQFEEPTDGQGNQLSEADQDALEQELNVRVLEAHALAERAGKVPAGVEGLIEDVLEPKVDWREKLRTFVGGVKPDDYSWAKPNRKMLSVYDIYMPASQTFGAGNLVVAVDTSGSVRDHELSEFLAEISAINQDYAPESLTVISCDSEIQHVEHYAQGETVETLSTKGRGGTRVAPVFDYLEEQGLPCDSLVYFTDLHVWDFPEAPDFPVLWCSTSGDSAPFGEVVRCEA